MIFSAIYLLAVLRTPTTPGQKITSRLEATSPLSGERASVVNPSKDVQFDPDMDRKLAMMETLTLRIRECMRDYQLIMLRQGIRDRKQMSAAAIKTCGGAMNALPADLREIGVAGLPLLAEQELNTILRYQR